MFPVPDPRDMRPVPQKSCRFSGSRRRYWPAKRQKSLYFPAEHGNQARRQVRSRLPPQADFAGGARRPPHLPFTMGHEIAGEIVALGPEASGVAIGDKVVAYPWIGCGECAVCRKGDELLCLNPRTLGTRRHGGYATHVVVPHPRYLLSHDGVPQALAATYTCSGITALSALKKAQDHVGPDDHLVIIGAGGGGGSAVHIAPAGIRGGNIFCRSHP